MGGKNGVELKNGDGTTSYIKYNLSASAVDNAGAAKDAAYGDKFTDKGGTERYFDNIVGVGAQALWRILGQQLTVMCISTMMLLIVRLQIIVE